MTKLKSKWLLAKLTFAENMADFFHVMLCKVKQAIEAKHRGQAVEAVRERIRRKQICIISMKSFTNETERNLRGYYLEGPIIIDQTILADSSVMGNSLADLSIHFRCSGNKNMSEHKLAETLAMHDGTLLVYDRRRMEHMSKLIVEANVRLTLALHSKTSLRYRTLQKLHNYFVDIENKTNTELYEEVFLKEATKEA
ncbi:hypothetical protein MA9V1_102 [Chryseobacterium phage MA9V-1]|nr:hypothetical protein MA9V1_102 [Chryseobacterium phage MA9V-1]